MGVNKIYNVIKAGAKTKTGRKIISALTGGKQKTTGTEVITKFKPKLTKGESTKVWGQKLRGKFKKESRTEGLTFVIVGKTFLPNENHPIIFYPFHF